MAQSPERIITPMLSGISVTGENIFALHAPKNHPAPYIIFQRVDTDIDMHLKGASGIKQALVQVDVYTDEYWKTRAVAGSIQDILNGFRGQVQYTEDEQEETIDVRGITCQSDVDILDGTDDPILCRSTARYLITIKE